MIFLASVLAALDTMVVAENEGTEDATTVAVPLEQWNLIGSALKAAHTAVEAVAPPYEAYILDVEGALQPKLKLKEAVGRKGRPRAPTN